MGFVHQRNAKTFIVFILHFSLSFLAYVYKKIGSTSSFSALSLKHLSSSSSSSRKCHLYNLRFTSRFFPNFILTDFVFFFVSIYIIINPLKIRSDKKEIIFSTRAVHKSYKNPFTSGVHRLTIRVQTLIDRVTTRTCG